MQKRSSDDFDNDHTDELPVLLESAALEDALEDDTEPSLATPRAEDTSEHTALYSMAADAPGSSELLAELAARTEQIHSLEAQIRVLTGSARDLEQRAAEKDRRLQELNDSLATLRRSTEDSAAAERRLATQLAIRDARVAELTAGMERLKQEVAAYSVELQRLRDAAETARGQAESVRRELAARPVADPTLPDAQRLREDHAALAAYIAGRRTWWDETQAANGRLAARVAALEHELAANGKRLAAADALATRESTRAVALRAELVDTARRVDTLQRELRLAHAAAATPPTPAPAALTPTPAPTPTPSATQAAEPAPVAAVDLIWNVGAPVNAALATASLQESLPVLTDAVDAVAPAVEAIAQLEAEVEYKRQQVAAQVVELRDREQRLRSAASELEHARREAGTLRTELDDSRSSSARLERAVLDKDRALEARDARIATLQEELKQRLGAVEKRTSGDFSPLDSAAARAGSRDGATDNASAPVLMCLTGDAPKRFALTKKTITIGRGPHCDLQVLTHFVSREHARLTLSGHIALIEDLGSRNGVFVNSVRVDRQQLQHGDLLTIGETQFRFVESMAH